MLGLLLGAAVLLGLFVVVENRSAAPLVPLRMFRSRMFVAGNLAMALIGMAAWEMNFTASGYARLVLDYSPLQFGLATTAMTLTAVASTRPSPAWRREITTRAAANRVDPVGGDAAARVH